MKRPPAKRHYSATFEIAYRVGVHPRTVQRYTRRDRRQWRQMGADDVALVVAAIDDGRARCYSQPLRHAVPCAQLTLEWD